MPLGFSQPPSKFFESRPMGAYWFPGIMVSKSLDRSPKIPESLAFLVLGSILLENCEKPQDRMRLLKMESEPSKRGEASSRFLVDLEKLRVHLPFRPTSRFER